MLKFVANYTDGSSYFQNDADASVKESERNCFFDVEHDRLASFELCGADGRCFGVDLLDGHFEVGGVSFRMHDEDITDIRLIYFRRVTLQFNIMHEEVGRAVAYRLGWQALDRKGKNVQRIMEID